MPGHYWTNNDLTHRSYHYSDGIMGAMASQITSLAIVYSTDYSGADERKCQSSASLAFVRGIHRWPVNSPHKGPVTWKVFPFDDVIVIGSFPIYITGDHWVNPWCDASSPKVTLSHNDIMDNVIWPSVCNSKPSLFSVVSSVPTDDQAPLGATLFTAPWRNLGQGY